MPAVLAKDGAAIEPGRIYIAQPGYHLLLEEKAMKVIRGPRENRFRPSIDVLFRSAAVAFGPRTVGIILSGTMDDGKAGLEAIHLANGRTMVQSQEDALFPQLPLNASRAIKVQHSLAIPELARSLVELVQKDSRTPGPALDDLAKEVIMVKETGDHIRLISEIGKLTPLKCPDCGGPLWEINESAVLRFRCHLGHALSVETLGSGTEQDTEKALWQAVELMKEQSSLYGQMAQRARPADPAQADQLQSKADRCKSQAEILERLAKEYPSHPS